ncbi:MAG: hypothetical protein ABIF10_05175 [Candidatus Woesearchaeota archaeon]
MRQSKFLGKLVLLSSLATTPLSCGSTDEAFTFDLGHRAPMAISSQSTIKDCDILKKSFHKANRMEKIQPLSTQNYSLENRLAESENKTQKQPWHSSPVGYGIALGVGVVSAILTIAVADTYRRLRVTRSYKEVANDYATYRQFEQAINAAEHALLVDPMNKKARIQIVKYSILQQERLVVIKKNVEVNQLREATQRAHIEIGMLKKYHKKDFAPYMYEGDLYDLMMERSGNIKIKQELMQNALDAYDKAIDCHCTSLKRFPLESSVTIFHQKHAELNHLYRQLGQLELDLGWITDSKLHLQAARRYNKDDNKTERLLEKVGKYEEDLNKQKYLRSW